MKSNFKINKYDVPIYIFFMIIFLCKGFNLQSENAIYLYSYIFGFLIVIMKMFTDKFSLKEITLIVFMYLISFIVFIKTKNPSPLFFSISICCLKNVDINNIIKIAFYTSVFSLICMIVFSSAGIIDNRIVHLTRNGFLISRYSFGYVHPNIVQMQLLLICLMYYYLYNKKNSKLFSILFLFINYLLYKFTYSRTSFLLINILVFYELFFKNNKVFNKIIIDFSRFSFPFFFAISILLSKYYGKSSLVQLLDSFFTGRIYYGAYLLHHYSLPFFGRVYSEVMFDNSYIYLLYSCGIVFMIIYSYLFIKMSIILYKNKMFRELYFLFLISVFALTENIFLSPNLNFINYFMAYVLFETKKIR